MAETVPLVDGGAPTMKPLLSVKDLAVHYRVQASIPAASALPTDLRGWRRMLSLLQGEAVLRAVDGVDFHVLPGETLGLVGESGCGKTTTGRALLRLEAPVRGQIELDGIRVIKARRRDRRPLYRRMQMVFQDPYASLDPRLTVGQIVGEPLRALGLEPRARPRRERVAQLLESCGLDARSMNRYPHEFSGGQRQRIAIARAIAPGPRMIVADEPVSALDVSVQAQIVNLLLELQERFGLSMLFIAHDLSVVRHVSQRVAVMYLGKVVEVAPAGQLPWSALHPYTRALIDAVPVPDPVRQRQKKRFYVEGEVPSALDPPPGCRFHPRCPEVTERCRVEEPLLKIGKLDRPVACHVAHGEG